MSDDLPRKPRNAPHAEEPGAYGLAVRLSTAVVDPGETVTLEVFVSGYGQIQGSKLVFYPSPAIVDERSSYRYGLGPPQGESVACFGVQEERLDPLGNTIDFCGGLLFPETERPTMYFDASTAGELPPISMEQKTRGTDCAPVQVKLVTRWDARPGTYMVQFLFTYFNGSAWENSSETVQFSVRGFYQRHEGWIWFMGAVATLIAVSLGVRELYTWLLQLVS